MRKQYIVPWTRAEDALIVEHAKKGADAILEMLPGRSLNAVWKRASYLGVSVRAENPQTVGDRYLLAKTCWECGRLLPGNRFEDAHNSGKRNKCRTCTTVGNPAAKRFMDQANSETAAHASRHRKPWLQWEDKKLDPELGTPLTQLALELGRTYKAVRHRRHLLYQLSSPSLDPREGLWRVQTKEK